jgi:hypothetical protein
MRPLRLLIQIKSLQKLILPSLLQEDLQEVLVLILRHKLPARHRLESHRSENMSLLLLRLHKKHREK